MARRRKEAIPRISPTRLNTYLACPRQYFFSYIRRIPRRPHSFFSFGASLHATLQGFHEEGGTQTQEVTHLTERLKTTWIDAGYESQEEQAARLEQGEQILSAYYAAEQEREAETLFLEKMLSIPVEGFILTGRLDRVDRRPDGLLEVIDYKSGGYLPEPEELADDLAIGIYQLLVSRRLETPAVLGTIYNLRFNRGVSLLREEPQLRDIESRVTEAFHVLSSDTDFNPSPGPACRYCDFRHLCPDAE